MKRFILAILVIITVISCSGCVSNEELLSAMESDTTTTDMLVREALLTYLARINDVYFYGKTADEATVYDVLFNDLCDDSRYVNDFLYGDEDWLQRKIGNTTYKMVWDGHNVVISGGDYNNSGTELTYNTIISSLDTTDFL